MATGHRFTYWQGSDGVCVGQSGSRKSMAERTPICPISSFSDGRVSFAHLFHGTDHRTNRSLLPGPGMDRLELPHPEAVAKGIGTIGVFRPETAILCLERLYPEEFPDYWPLAETLDKLRENIADLLRHLAR